MDSLIQDSHIPTSAPVVSFIIPCYNHEKYISKTLDSIKNDNFPNKEIVIIDDGSTDNSVLIIKKWISVNPEIDIKLFQQQNIGIVATLNKLVKISCGEYIRIFSSDDINMPDSTTKLFNALVKNRGFDAAFSDAIVIDSDDNVIFDSAIKFQKKNRNMYIKDLGRALISEWGVSGPCILYTRRSYFEILKMYDESLTIEDWYSYLKFYAHKKLLFIDDYIIYYRVHKSNNSRTKDIKTRIKNQQSHKTTIELVAPYFKGIEKVLLNSEKFLNLAKLYFLNKKYLCCCFYLTAFIMTHMYVKVHYWLKDFLVYFK